MLLRYKGSSDTPALWATTNVPFLDFVARNFDSAWYLSRNPDVAASKIDPLKHWLNYGLQEGRAFSPELDIRFQVEEQVTDDPSAQTFEYGGATIVVRHRQQDDDEFLSFIEKHFAGEWYLSTNPDLAIAKLDPWQHWIDHGIWEKRKPAPWIEIQFNGDRRPENSHFARHFTYQGKPLTVRTLDPDILRQILDQGALEPAVLSPGSLALAALRQIDAPDLLPRYGIDTTALFAPFKENPKYVFIMNRVGVGGSEKYLSDIVGVLLENGERSIAIIVTDQYERDAGDWRSLSILQPLAARDILFWPDACGWYRSYDASAAYDSSGVLARFLNALRPQHIFVANCRLGFDAIARFGRGLSHFASIYCAYYCLGNRALGAPYALRFPAQTAPYAISVTDNKPVADILKQHYGPLHEKGIRILNLRLKAVDAEEFSKRLRARKKRFAMTSRKNRWVWISRLNSYQKKTRALAELARIRRIDQFDIYGPVESPLEEQGLVAPNIKYCGVLTDVIAADLSEYDAFIFTSSFEGMPNIVIEMTNHAIPMILSKVGGLGDTFDETAVSFVEPDENAIEMAKAFSGKMDFVRALAPDKLENRIKKMQEQVLRVHHAEIYKKDVLQLFGAV